MRVFLFSTVIFLGTAFFGHADNSPATNSGSSTAASLMEKATSDATDGKLDQAVSEATAALELDPNNKDALDLRGSIYAQQRLWDLAQRDLLRLTQISPDPAYQYKLAQIKFLQRQYDDARPIFAALRDDPRLGDLARYKVFICDLLGAHDAIAERDLATLDQTGQKPSFYYGRAIWAASQHDQRTANRLDAEATGRFSTTLVALYRNVFADAHLFRLTVATFTTRDGRHFDHADVGLEEDGLRVSASDKWVTIPLKQLPDDLSGFPEDLRDQINLRRHSTDSTGTNALPVSFTTRSGTSYRQVRWSAEDTGLAVLTPNGWVTVPFADLPDDPGSFPADVRQQIEAKRAKTAASMTPSSMVSFTTRRGKSYDEVQAYLGDEGVELSTDNGPVTVPFADLPADLSPFPADWRTVIEGQVKSGTSDAGAEATVTFTTQKGVPYHAATAALGGDGVMILTSNGWSTVPFTDLPADLTPFPTTWRPLIQRWLQTSAGDTSGIEVVSFTTRRGKQYDQVRATLDDKGLDVLGPDGWVEVSFDQVPDDLSPFPAAWREAIAAGQKTADVAPTATPNN